MNVRIFFAAALVSALACLAGCAPKADDKPASTLTEAQRDSAIARSSLPGASTVGKALEVSGNEATRATQMDSSAH